MKDLYRRLELDDPILDDMHVDFLVLGGFCQGTMSIDSGVDVKSNITSRNVRMREASYGQLKMILRGREEVLGLPRRMALKLEGIIQVDLFTVR